MPRIEGGQVVGTPFPGPLVLLLERFGYLTIGCVGGQGQVPVADSGIALDLHDR